MELQLEVVLSSSIKRKKPWPRFCWLGREKESVFLLDDKRISEINMVSGRTKKRTPKLHPLLNNVLTMASSHCGTWLCGVLVAGELFLWNKDRDLLKTVGAAPEVVDIIASSQGNTGRLSVQVSGDATRLLLVASTGQVFLWECVDVRDLTGLRDGTVKGCWARIEPAEGTILPSLHDKEASRHTVFVKTEALGDVCLLALVFVSGQKLILSCLRVQWEERHMRVGSVGYSAQWATKTFPLSDLNPPCRPVKSRGALVPAFSPDGQLLAIILNQKQPKATQVLYVSTQNFVSVSSSLGGCGVKAKEVPSKYIRSYWVSSVSWSTNSLFLACVLKRGSLLMLARLGRLITLTSSGCSVDFGPAQFLPLHPLVTYRPPFSAGKVDASLSSSSLSVRDVMRQRYSVTWHPRLLYLIVSDGYMATVMRVLHRPSPVTLLKMLLKDTTSDLEKLSEKLCKSQVQVRSWLYSVSCLNLESSLEALNSTSRPSNSTISAGTDVCTLPLFLQDLGASGGTTGLLEKVQSFLEDDSDFDGPPAGSHVEEGGRLEFASMFDTLHAQDTNTAAGPATWTDDSVEEEGKIHPFHRDVGKIQSRLLTVWAVSVSLGGAVEHRAALVKHTLLCLVRVAALVHLIPSYMVSAGRAAKVAASSHVLRQVRALLSFLPWDKTRRDGPCCLGLVVEFTDRLVTLLLTPYNESYRSGQYQPSAQSLSRTLQVLQLVSCELDKAYGLQQRHVWSSEDQRPLCQPSDVHHIPLLQEEKEKEVVSLCEAQPVPQRPSSRLFAVWQRVYDVTRQYLEKLSVFDGYDGWEEEQRQCVFIMSQIQTALQTTGERLEEEPALLSYTGEHLYLCGLYQQSADVWKSQLCDKSNKLCGRRVFQETRACLALLYSFLSQYRLREAQELGDHMAALLLHRCGHVKDNVHMADSSPCSWLPSDLHCEAACAVVQSLGRFMASYFSNQALHILPPHHVAVLPPLHLPHAPTVGRLVPLHQQEVASAVRRHHLSEVWTVDYALDLLLLGGLLPEAVWLASHLGDWKTAVSLSLAFSSCSRSHLDFSKLRSRDLHLPKALRVKHMFQAQLRRLLGNKLDARDQRDEDDEKSLSDPLDGLDWDLLLVSVQEILKASVMAAVDVITSPLSSLLDTAKDLSCCLPLLVPSGLYLPSPPLYCPQPSPNTQDPVGTPGHLAEVAARHKVSGVIQKLLLLLRSARCCRPAAQWYITHLRRARHVLFKIRKKYSYPGAAEEEEPFHEGLMKFVARHGFFRWRPNKDSRLDPDVVRTIICFRELCALCWMLHVRDQLSLTCRKYQAARQNPGDSEVTSCCAEALRWACRFLPFARFLDAEEILQDVLLSLVAELPPVSLVAETLVRCFPEEGESVRVSLREKYNSLTQRLRHSTVLEGANGENESMMVLVQDEYRQRRKHLGRLRRHLAPPQLHLWEKEDEEEERRGGERGSAAMLGQLSLGTSLSTSTLNDCGFPPVCSDAENTSEAVSPDQQGRPSSSEKNNRNIKHKQQPDGMQSSAQKDRHQPDTDENKETSLPAVGSWEFELDDEEYLNFLELFLSYELEKDGADGADLASELPLLKSFSSKLKERELHSLTFDVLTTVHRRQRDVQLTGRRQWSSHPPVFRAGHCYRPVTSAEPSTPSIWNKTQNPRISRSLSLSSVPGQKNSRQEGLFGLRRQNSLSSVQNTSAGHVSFETSAFPISRHPEGLGLGSLTSPEAVVELQQCLDPRLEAEFPALGRLLEWMVRWADRRVLLGQHGNKGKGGGGGGGGPENEGIVIRVKASAPAILTALSLLQWRYSVVPGGGSHAHVPSVLLTEVDRKLDQESSVDTGYPGSTHTPVTAPERHLQQLKLSSGSSTDETEEQEQEQEHHRVPLHVRIHRRRSPQPPPPQSDLEEVTAGEEEESADARGRLDVSSPDLNQNNSENICAPDESLKVADLDASDKQQPSITDSLNLQPPAPPPPPPPQPQPKPRVIPAAQPQVTDSVGAEFPLTPVDPPELHPRSSTPAAAAPPSQSLNQSSNMRQQLGQDLFRLVQNINYMNMMEVLGASFANLQLAQQNSLTQSNIVPSFHGPNINAVPRPNTSHVQATQTFTAQSQITRHEPPTSTAAADHHQEMRPLSVHVESPEIHFGLSRKLIPSSQGLLTTTDTRRADAPALGAQSFGSHVQNENADSVLGKKHQRHCAQLPQQIAPKCPPLQEPKLLFLENSNVSQEPKTSSRREEEDKRKTWTSALKRQLSFDLPFDSVSRNPQRQLHSSEKSRGQEFTLLPPAQKPAAPPQGLQLLRFQSVTHDDVAFPKIPVLFSFKPPAVVPAPVQETPLIKLSFKDPGLQNMFPVASSSSMPMTRLMSVDQLRSSVTSRQKSGDAQMQLLKVDPPPTAPAADVAAAASSGFNSSKRQKRREGKAVSERKAEVTFRPNDSIIPTEEVKEEDGVKVESAAAQEVVQGINFAFPLGSFDYLLSGQSLSDTALPTSAELHAFAATRKTPTECQDAFTNTDSGCPPTLQDKSVSTSLTFISPEAPTTQEVLKVRDGNVTEDAREGDETFLDTRCYRLIRIEDLEDAARHQDLLSRLGPQTQHVSSVQSSASASANVHILETPVIEAVAAVAAAPAAAPGGGVGSLQSEAGAETPLLTTSHRGEGSNMNRHLQSSTDFTQDVWEPLDSRICRAIKSVSVGAHRVSSSPPSVWFSARMSELDAQLAALQRIADCLEEDFSNSRMLVNTIENLCPVTAPGVKRNVRLSVPQEALMRPSNTLEDEKENWGNKPGLLGDPRTPQEKSQFLRCSSPYSCRAGPSHLHSPPTKERDYLTEVSGISLGSEDEHLAPSGLSDTAELLEKLVDEGYLSPSDLDWSNLQTHSRLHQSQRNNRSQKNVRTEDERRELRIWMRRKQRERLAVYQKHRESLREREKKPFCPSGKAPSAGRPRASGLGGKKEREIAALLKQHKQRALEACSLVGSFSTPPPDTLSLPLENTYSIYRTPASDKRVLKSNLGQTLTMEHGRRIEPHRPVTSSPKTHVLTTRQSQERHDSYQMRSGGRGVQRTEYGDEVKRLEPISEVNSLVDQEEPEFNLDGAPHIGGSGMDWLENLSQNTGSTLSKIDWAAVERMVAAVED